MTFQQRPRSVLWRAERPRKSRALRRRQAVQRRSGKQQRVRQPARVPPSPLAPVLDSKSASHHRLHLPHASLKTFRTRAPRRMLKETPTTNTFPRPASLRRAEGDHRRI